MTPVLHDSQEWRDVQKQLRDIAVELARLNGKLGTLGTTQQGQHNSNLGQIDEIKKRIADLELILDGDGTDDRPGLRIQIATMVAVTESAEKHAKSTASWVKWGIGLALTLFGLFCGAIGLYLQYFEAHHKVSDEKPAIVSHGPEVSTDPSIEKMRNGVD